ncbi:MAG: succinyl-diaminopimelate desuccinylase [Halobacteriales archaeon SW_9_67_25]|nr:MAG: succinyl-diaminopimelate desuccinylase [Halobacteriales archaeon SW_9_67_25]
MPFDVDSFLRDAVRTPSHEDVTAMRDLVVETLEGAGVETSVDEVGTVVATRGTGSPHLVFNTHIDTVPPRVEYRDQGDVVYGRGACDAKGPLAAMVQAFLAASPGSGRLTLALSPDEETTQVGGATLAERLDADSTVVGEPTGLDACVAARGQFEGSVTVRGESAHAADPDEGTNSIRAACAVLRAMDTYDEEQGPGTHAVLGRPTLVPSLVSGGEAINQVPAECTIRFDRRSVPPETAGGFVTGLQRHLRRTGPEGVEVSVSLLRSDIPHPEAFRTDPDARIVRSLEDAGAGETRPFGAATEASYFAARAPTVVFGPGVLADESGPVAHADREYVDRRDVERAESVLRETAELFLQ